MEDGQTCRKELRAGRAAAERGRGNWARRAQQGSAERRRVQQGTGGCRRRAPPVVAGHKKMGKLLISHRYDHIPLLDSSPGGFCGSWSY